MLSPQRMASQEGREHAKAVISRWRRRLMVSVRAVVEGRDERKVRRAESLEGGGEGVDDEGEDEDSSGTGMLFWVRSSARSGRAMTSEMGRVVYVWSG